MSKPITDIPYTMTSMLSAMNNKEKIQEGIFYSGALNHMDLLIDIELLFEISKLTEKQKKVIDLYFFKQYTQKEVSEILGISQQAVLDHIGKVKKKLEAGLELWRKKDEELSKKFNLQ